MYYNKFNLIIILTMKFYVGFLNKSVCLSPKKKVDLLGLKDFWMT